MQMGISRPRFRTDLVAECIDADGQRFIDVIDPETGDGFRFYEVEYSLACAMDGARDVPGLVQWAKEELGIEPSRTELEQVITTLDTLGYLDSGRPTREEIELRAGVFAGPPAAMPVPAADVELGMPGGAPQPSELPPVSRAEYELGDAGGKPTRRMGELSRDEVELGMPGAPPPPEPMASLRRATRPDADDDGPTHLPAARVADFDDEVSVDLSEHLSIRPSDVKEAVRASRSMKAVEVPPEMLDELGQKEQDAARQAARSAVAAPTEHTLEADEPTPRPGELPRVPERPVVEPRAPEPVAARAPHELPGKPVVVSRRREPAPEKPAEKAVAKPPVEQPRTGPSGLLLVLLALVILGAGAFAVWKYVLSKPATTEQTSGTGPSGTTAANTTAGTGATTGTATTPGTGATAGTSAGTAAGTAAEKAAPPPEGTLAAGEQAEEIEAKAGGIVASVVAKDTAVESGDAVVELQGAGPLKAKLGNAKGGLVWDIETRVPREIELATKKRDAASAAGNARAVKQHDAKIKERTKRLEEKKQEADDLRAKIAALSVEAPAAGKVQPLVKAGDKIAAGQTVAKLAGGGELVVTFDAPGSSFQPDAPVRVAAKDKPDQKASCTVSAVEGSKVTVSCAPDAGLAAGTVVVLEK